MQRALFVSLLLSVIILLGLVASETQFLPTHPFKISKGVVVYGYWSFTDEQVKYIADNFDIVVTGYHPNKAENIKQLKQLNPDSKVILYADIVATSVDHLFKDWTEINSHEDWFVHDLDGNRMIKLPWKWYLLDIGNNGWKKYYADLCVKMFEVIPDADGIMADDCWASMSTWNWITPNGTPIPPDRCPALPNWNTAMKEFLTYVKSRIGNDKLLIPNTNTYNGYVDYCDGKCSEGFVHPPWWDSTYFSTSFDYMKQMSEYQEVVKKGKYLFVCDGIADRDTATFENTKRCFDFSLASYLLIVEGEKTSFYFAKAGFWPYTNTDDFLPYIDQTQLLGRPQGDMYEWDYGLVRDFEHGKVIVNFSPYPGQMALEKTFRTLQGDIVTWITLPHHTGVMLFEVEG